MRAGREGFTLLELLLAVSVLGIVMAMLSISLSGIVRLKETAEQEEAVFQQAQTALRRIGEDLGGAVLLREEPFVGASVEHGRERADTLEFASRAHLIFNPEKQKVGLALIRYLVEADREEPRRLRLLRSDTPLLPEEKSEEKNQEPRERRQRMDESQPEELSFLLADNLRSVRFRYLNAKGQEFDSWQSPVDEGPEGTSSGLPAAVYCTLEIWLDMDADRYETFSTAMVVPLGLMPHVAKDEKK